MKKGYILSFLIGGAIGFLICNWTKNDEVIRYVKGETVTEMLPPEKIILEKEVMGNVIFLPSIYWIRDTVNNVVKEYPDTVKVFNDYLIERKYSFNLFDDNNGKMDIDTWVQFNKIKDFKYTFKPIQKEITKVQRRVLVPFASTSINTFSTVGIGGGLFYHNLGVNYNYLYNYEDNRRGHGFSFMIKF